MVLSDSSNKVGKIVMIRNIAAPYQRRLLTEIEAGASAIVVYRDRTDTPGLAMYYKRMGFDERKLTVPVVEAFEDFSLAHSLDKFRGQITSAGIQVSILPEENKWKKMNDLSGVQIFINVLLSSMEIGILFIAVHRVYIWHRFSPTGLLSIGPVCIFLESIAAALRLANTLVDPFTSFRTLPTPFTEILLTAYLPFQLSAGILLTFFWAETLTSNQVQAVPFISEYKVSCFIAIAVLFVGEIVSSTVRNILPVSSFNPAYVVEAFYGIVCIVLTVCYLMCAKQISDRLKRSRAPKTHIRWLTFRFALSSGGYITFVILIILLIWFIGNPWGYKLIFSILFLNANVTALMQVWAFVPPSYAKKTSQSTPLEGEKSSGHDLTLRTKSAPTPASDAEV